MKESKFQFLNPNLEELVFVENKDFNNSGQLEVVSEKELQVYKDDENYAKVELTLSLNKELDDNRPFSLKITISAIFTWNEIEESDLEEFLNINAQSLLIGYARPIIASVTSSSRFPTYNLPFVNLNDE